MKKRTHEEMNAAAPPAATSTKPKSFTLHPLSAEQTCVIDALRSGHNVLVNSVAGSGKTTCNLHVAKTFPEKRILLLTYNAKLKMETRDRVVGCKIGNMMVHSYHSFCVKYYDDKAFTDSKITELITRQAEPLQPFAFDLIVLDEAQDMTALFYELVMKLVQDNMVRHPQIAVFGDHMQSIYDQVRGSDQRYLLHADRLFTVNSYPWSRCEFRISYRITKRMATFVNKCMLGEERMVAVKDTDDRNPRYVICKNKSPIPFMEVMRYIRGDGGQKKYKPWEIFVLAPSVRKKGLGENSPVIELENNLKLRGTYPAKDNPNKNILVYAASDDEEHVDESVIRDKLLISSIHQSKGMERKVVIVLGFDDFFFRCFRSRVSNVCPNELYVAATRGMERISFIHFACNQYLPFLNIESLNSCTDFRGHSPLFSQKKTDSSAMDADPVYCSVTTMLQHLPFQLIDECVDLMNVSADERFPCMRIPLPPVINGGVSNEAVSDITGTAIPMLMELTLTGKSTVYETLLHQRKINSVESKIPKVNGTRKRDQFDNLVSIRSIDLATWVVNDKQKVHELLFVATCYFTHVNGYVFKMCQINKFDWITPANCEAMHARMLRLGVPRNSRFEFMMIDVIDYGTDQIRLSGYIDCIDMDRHIVYEFKCVSELKKEHFLQLVLYKFMYERRRQKILANPEKYIDDHDTTGETDEETVDTADTATDIRLQSLLDQCRQCEKDMARVQAEIQLLASSPAASEGDHARLEQEAKEIERRMAEWSEAGRADAVAEDEVSWEEKMGLMWEMDFWSREYELRKSTAEERRREVETLRIPPTYVLYNIRTNDYFQVTCDAVKTEQLFWLIMKSKMQKKIPMPDSVFFQANRDIFEKYDFDRPLFSGDGEAQEMTEEMFMEMYS